MKITILNSRLNVLNLPSKVDGSFALQDIPNSDEILVNVETSSGTWIINSTRDCKVEVDGINRESAVVEKNKFYTLIKGNEKKVIYAEDSFDDTFKLYAVSNKGQFIVGRSTDSHISYNCNYILPQHCALYYENGKWSAQLGKGATIYINGNLHIDGQMELHNGDIIFIYGLRIILMANLIMINNPSNKVMLNTLVFSPREIKQPVIEYEEIKEVDYYTEDDYFFKTPRLRRFIETYDLKFANPPSGQKKEDTPFILTAGPSLTMGIVSVTMLLNTLGNLTSGNQNGFTVFTRLVSSIAMLISSLVWPNLIKKYNKQKDARNEKIRKEKYRDYLEKKRKEMVAEGVNQTEILKENLLSVSECYNIIVNRKRTLWERKISQQDFLTVRVGTGDIPIDMNIQFNEEEFSIEEDELKIEAQEVVNQNNKLLGVPVGYSFYNKKATAIMGIESKLNDFARNIILQLITFHSYDDLKIVILTDKNKESNWEAFKGLPHCFSNNKSIRFFATDIDEMKTVSNYLEQEFISRITMSDNKVQQIENEDKDNKITYAPYYLIFADNFSKVRRLGISELILKNKENYGFGFVIVENSLGKLPSECINFITIGNQTSGILRNDLDDYYHQDFNDEIDKNINLNKCCEVLADIPIEFYEDVRYLPKNLGFLEMQKVGKVEQLNTLNRWRLNDPTKSLKAAIGINDLSNTVYLDLHEKYHGPHGLIAGTTGSGKSEFIITYVLSMALNYSPNEVSFILIDYKGGGLAGAFENKTNNIRLPHLAGTITNLDKGELNRTLVSIDSELRKRQRMFNEARDKLGESTIDIYKYQKFFRQKKITDPIPHLFIICDEFAELKAQQPEFMDNLISTARIGRSLGVHLILATQKPSGVVNDQIWSNTKFRVCLKVQDKSDSNEMLKRPEAADLKDAGRFYLQVGNNELFLLGQSGWAGTQYSPSDTVNKEVDKSITYLDNVGASIKDYDETVTVVKPTNNLGDELSNVLKYVTDLAKKENVASPRLWLDNIPETIYTDSIIAKYNYRPEPFKLEAIIGEYDDPSNQKQGLVKIKLDETGNTAIYGTNGSNREMFLNTLIYSLCVTHSAEEVNFYIFDFGSEASRMFKDMPHVGDIVYASDEEKIGKLNVMIGEEIEKRKNLFADYNGEYDNYCRNSGKTLPRKIFIYNNFDSYREMFPACDDLLVKYSREGLRYGIIIIFTANSSSGLYSRMLRNFENVFVLDMPTRDQYFAILGAIGNVFPAQYDGRGLFKKEDTYEFQTAQIYPSDRLVEYIKKKTVEIKSRNTYTAERIPVLPEILSFDMIKQANPTLKNVPIGMEKDTLSICKLNVQADKGQIVCSNDLEALPQFINNLGIAIKNVPDANTILLDFEKLLSEYKDSFNHYVDDDIETYLTELNKKISEEGLKNNKLVIIVFGIEKMKTKLPLAVFNEFITNIKKTENLELIACDTSYKLKKYLFEPWFTENFVNANGIWIGNGVADQGIIRISELSKKYRSKISNNYAWVFKNGFGVLVKIVNEGVKR